METKNELIVGRQDGVNVTVSLNDPKALEQARDNLERELAIIRTQLGEARAKAGDTGVYADRDWYAKANGALRFKGAAHQRILRRLGELKREQRAGKDRSREQRFIDAARRRLKPEVFREIWEEVDQTLPE